MSFFFGICQINQKPVDRLEIEQMYASIRHYPHEKYNFFIENEVGLGHCLTYNTPEAIFENSPKYLSQEQISFVSQGRIDNREDLADDLGIRLTNKIPDGDLMLKAYLKWGEDCTTKLRGDWAFVVYDFVAKTLFIARDHHGYTSVYYYFDGKRFVFAPTSKAIFALDGIHKKLNLEAFIRQLVLWHKDDTFLSTFQDVHIIPPAHTLKLKNGKIELKRYWFPENIEPIHRKNKQDYAEELREIFTKAVEVRLRSHKPVGAFLSGGLDSSSVAVTAAELLAKQNKRLTTLSHVPLFKNELAKEPTSNQLTDESPNIEATIRHSGNIDGHLIDSADISVIDGFKQALDCFDELFHAASNAFWLVDLPQKAYSKGLGVLLTGEHGNGTISYTGLDYLLPISHPYFLKNPSKLLKTAIAKPLVLKYYPQFFDKSKNSIIAYIQKSHLKQELIEEWDILNEIKQSNRRFVRYYPDAKAGMLDILRIGRNLRCFIGGIKTNCFGVEYRDATADVNVIEYCLSIPNEAFFNELKESKQILKNMMKGKLPDEVLFCKKKGLQAADIKYRILNEQNQITDLLLNFEQNKGIHEVLDIDKLKNDWLKIQNQKIYQILDIQQFVKTLMFAYLASKNNF